MEKNADSDVTKGTEKCHVGATAKRASSITGSAEILTGKQVVKLTAKALAGKVEGLQNERKFKLNKARTMRKTMQCFMSNDDKMGLQNALDELVKVCNEARCINDSLLSLLPCVKKEKHDTWFKANMISNDESIANAKKWVLCHDGSVVNGNVKHMEDDVRPEDSISKTEGKHSSQRSHRSGNSSTTSSVRIKAEAERAALLARQAALKERHALE